MVTHSSLTHTLSAGERQDANRTGMQTHSDALLQASRRVDWRFLLPDPELGQVACVGPARGTLPESLRLFSASLTLIETPRACGDTAQYDVVVASGPSYQTLRQMARLVRPGGFLYVEAHRRLWPGRPVSVKVPQPRCAADYLAVVERLGFVEAQAYWHWPDFESCSEIVPLDDRAALVHVFTRRRSDVATRLKSTLGRWLLWSGLLALVIPCFSIVAHRPGR